MRVRDKNRASVSTARCPVINGGGCFARTSRFFGPRSRWSRMDDPTVGRFICQILLMLFIPHEGWAGQLSLKRNPCVCYCLTAESVQPQVNSFWYPESLAIFWMNLHPVLGFHVSGTSSYMQNWGKSIRPLPRQCCRKYIQLDASSDISLREVWDQEFRCKRGVAGLGWKMATQWLSVKHCLLFCRWFFCLCQLKNSLMTVKLYPSHSQSLKKRTEIMTSLSYGVDDIFDLI